MKKTFYLTKEGHEELIAERQGLVDNRKSIAEQIATARSQGDLSENTEYQSARDEQNRNESRISEIEHILQNVELIKIPKDDNKVRLGSMVQLKDEKGKTKKFQVVGTVEADPLNGKISDESPIGKALLGRKEGEDVEIKTPIETATYTIADIG